VVAIGPVLTGYEFFTEITGPGEPRTSAVELSSALVQLAREFPNAEEGNVYYDAHVEYLQRIAGVVGRGGGSALLAGDFGRTAIHAATRFPVELFETLDRDWQQSAREADAGDLGFLAPRVLSIVLTRCARREAIPAIIQDLRQEWADARAKVWALVDSLEDRVHDCGSARDSARTAGSLSPVIAH
jgi:hypothetical protein